MQPCEPGTLERNQELKALRALLSFATDSAERIGADRLASAIAKACEIAAEESKAHPVAGCRRR